jgi:predicted ATP-grasp superfamily ATP-dependent carboligase
MPRTAIVLNMFYTGLGIARSLGEHGVPVTGLTAREGIYGNYTRYATLRACPDSRDEPEKLFSFLLKLGAEAADRPIIFPTRDDDVLFLDHYREPLARYFDLILPSPGAVRGCLDKWETYLHARHARVDTPQCWVVGDKQDLLDAADEISYPCVMKPVFSNDWRVKDRWEQVGSRKAIGIESRGQLLAEYAQVSVADPRVLIQEMVPGEDDQLFIVACYLDRDCRLVASFTAQKLLQIPAGFGTGCVVQTVDRPELVEPAAALLRSLGFSGIAEVEFKRDASCGKYKLIEVNARPWDQHTLGKASGVDLIYIAYCEAAGLPLPAIRVSEAGWKWIAEDAYLTAALRLMWKRDRGILRLAAVGRGRRTYGIWSGSDKRPFIIYMTKFVPQLIWTGLRRLFKQASLPYYRRLDAKAKG